MAYYQNFSFLKPSSPSRGTEGVLEPYGTDAGFWNARRAILYCSLAGDISPSYKHAPS